MFEHDSVEFGPAAQVPGANPQGGPRQGDPSSAYQQIPLGALCPARTQPRHQFEETSLAELAESIRIHGILQPLLVRPAGDPDRYEIVAGGRRWRAAQSLGLIEVPAIVRCLAEEEAVEAALIENLQREDLTPLEQAWALSRLREEGGYSIRKLADRLGKKRGWVEERLRLVSLPEDLQAMVSGRPDTATHARELERVSDPELRQHLIGAVLEQGMSLAALRQCLQEAAPAEPAVDKAVPAARGAEAAGEAAHEEGVAPAPLSLTEASPEEAVAISPPVLPAPVSDRPAPVDRPVRVVSEATEESAPVDLLLADLQCLQRALLALAFPSDAGLCQKLSTELYETMEILMTVTDRLEKTLAVA